MPEKTLAMYIRLSVEDGDLRSSTDKSESNSVTNQRKILQSYISSVTDTRKNLIFMWEIVLMQFLR